MPSNPHLTEATAKRLAMLTNATHEGVTAEAREEEGRWYTFIDWHTPLGITSRFYTEVTLEEVEAEGKGVRAHVARTQASQEGMVVRAVAALPDPDMAHGVACPFGCTHQATASGWVVERPTESGHSPACPVSWARKWHPEVTPVAASATPGYRATREEREPTLEEARAVAADATLRTLVTLLTPDMLTFAREGRLAWASTWLKGTPSRVVVERLTTEPAQYPQGTVLYEVRAYQGWEESPDREVLLCEEGDVTPLETALPHYLKGVTAFAAWRVLQRREEEEEGARG